MARRTLVEEIERLLDRAEAEAGQHAEAVLRHRDAAREAEARAVEAASKQAETLNLRDALHGALGR